MRVECADAIIRGAIYDSVISRLEADKVTITKKVKGTVKAEVMRYKISHGFRTAGGNLTGFASTDVDSIYYQVRGMV